MKIIALAGERKRKDYGTDRIYLVEATGDELAQLVGHDNEYRAANDTTGAAFKVGKTLSLKGWRDSIRRFHSAANALYAMPEKLRELATNLEARTPRWKDPDEERTDA